MRALIDGRSWQATRVIARLCGGFLALAGSDESWTVLTLAVPLGADAAPHVIGGSPANAVLMRGSAALAADQATGGGAIGLHWCSATRVTGTFSLYLISREGRPAVHVTGGRFDVPLARPRPGV